MARPSDFWANFKTQWYDDVTGELQEPHRTLLTKQGVTPLQIAEMEDTVKAEIAEFHRLDRENPVVGNETYNDRQLRLRNKNSKISLNQRIALQTSGFDPDKNY
jgi:hypothetical protein